MTTRQTNPGTVYQGANEEIVYTFDWANIGTPTLPEVSLYSGATQVTESCLEGNPVIAGDTIVSPKVVDLTVGVVYTLFCQITIGDNVYEAFVYIICEP